MQTSAIGEQRCGLGMPLAAEAEDRRRAAELLGQVRKRCDPDPAADEQRPRDVEVEAVAERAEHVELVPGLERAERARAGPDRIDQEGQLAGLREADAHRPRQHAARRLEHEELARDACVEAALLEPKQCVRPDLLGAA